MFEECLNKRCEIIVAFSDHWNDGAIPVKHEGIIKEVLEDSIKVELEDSTGKSFIFGKIKGKNFTIYIKKDYIISIMPID